ncbi:flavin reductase family protein [Psychroflexus sp. ALD_RP9]|uniref:flavin reductase family protein n=1 Tax=Psychroflexus sp. ALD_RP9 TaxID=2777186 RepID=UPI001A8FDA71|nr:flavin reductase [Psychroflexus sp. ALD_RP9]QSS97237.1 flavin reductase [Psychroflexus sp. ALD_RP9]
MKHLNKSDLNALESRYRANLINSCSGIKSVNLIGTKNNSGTTNLAIFNSVMHIGSNPPMLGFILRPTTVRRDTYTNILDQKKFTINQIPYDLIECAHQTSAKYEANTSEFDELNIEKEFIKEFEAPFVKSSALKIACSYTNSYLIEENGCRLIIGEIEHLIYDDRAQEKDGWLDVSKLKSTACIGLDAYVETKLIKRLSYAKPHKNLE